MMSSDALKPSRRRLGPIRTSRHAEWIALGLVAVVFLVLAMAACVGFFLLYEWHRSKGYGRWTTRAEAVSDGSALSIPSDFPRVIPRYPGARLIRDRLKRAPVHNQIELTFVSTDTVKSVHHFYKRFFESNGFGTGRFLSGTRIYRPGESASVVSHGGKGIARRIYISIKRKKGAPVTTFTIDTLDVVECGPGAGCYNFPGVTKSRLERSPASRPAGVEDLVRRAVRAGGPGGLSDELVGRLRRP